GTGIGAGGDKFDLRAFNFGAVATGDSANGDAGAGDSDRDDDGLADRIEEVIFTTPATVNSLTQVANFFREGAVSTGTARAVHVQLEAGTDNMRVFVDVDMDGNYNQATDLVFDLRDVLDNNAAIGGVATEQSLQNDTAADATGTGIFIFNDAQ